MHCYVYALWLKESSFLFIISLLGISKETRIFNHFKFLERSIETLQNANCDQMFYGTEYHSKSQLQSSVHSSKLIASRIPVILAYLTVAAIAGMNFSRYSCSPICLLILNT